MEVACRPGTRGASLEAEIVVERLSPSQAGQSTEGARLIEGFEDLARFADSPENQFAKYAWDAEHQGVPAKPGVAQSLELATDVVKAGKASARFTATSTRSDHAGWCARGARFSPPLDLSGYAAVGWWISDAGGQALKLQWRDTAGRWLDLVTPVDFRAGATWSSARGARRLRPLARGVLILYFNGIPAGSASPAMWMSSASSRGGPARAAPDGRQQDGPLPVALSRASAWCWTRPARPGTTRPMVGSWRL